MRSFNQLLVLAIISLSIFACNKDEDVLSTTSKTEMLVSNTWKISKMKVAQNNATLTDIYDIFYKDCEKDDTYKFYTDGSYMLFVGTEKCDTDELDQSGTWRFSGTQTRLIMNEGVEEEIVRLTETELVILNVESEFDPMTNETTTYTKEITFTAL